jgi:AraC family transcriptional activator of pobA
MAAAKRGKDRRSAPGGGDSVAVFTLYGETAPAAGQEFVHIEDITSRNLLYNWEIRAHRHQGLFQMVFIFEGQASLSLDGQSSELSGPCAVILPSAVVHGFRFTPGTHGYVLTLAESLLQGQEGRRERLLGECLLWEPAVIGLADSAGGGARLAVLLEQLHLEFRGAGAGRSVTLEWLMGVVLVLVARERARAAGAARLDSGQVDVFNRFRAEVETRFAQHWSVPDYAAALMLTESKLNRVCRAVAGRSAYDVAQARLLLEAKRKLLYLPVPAALIAYELGFEDPAYFWRFFRKHTGLTPAAFRKAQRARLSAAGEEEGR